MIGHRGVPSELDAMIARELHVGFSDDEKIVEDATEQFPDHDEPVVRAALAAALEKHAIEERDSRTVWSYDEEAPYEGFAAREGRVLLAAALWSYLTPQESKGYIDPAFGWLWPGAEPIEKPSSLARRGAFRASALAKDLKSHLDEVESDAVPDLVEEMIAAGETDLARSLLPKLHGDEQTLALIALGELPPVDVKATKERVSELETSYQDGEIRYTELERGQIVAAHALAASGDPESAFARLAPSLDEALELDRAPEAPHIEPRVSLELARLLLLAGRRDDALERVVACMAAGAWPRELLDVGHMLLSLAPPEKRPAIAARLRAAYDRAIVVLDELAPPPQAAPGAVS